VLVVLEGHVRDQFQLAGPLNVDTVEPVYQDVRDARVLEQRFQRTQPEDLVQNLARQPLSFREAEWNRLAVYRVADQDQYFFACGFAVRAAELFQVEAIQNLAVQVRFYLLVVSALEGGQICHVFFIPSGTKTVLSALRRRRSALKRQPGR